jgi:hypothetical protein
MLSSEMGAGAVGALLPTSPRLSWGAMAKDVADISHVVVLKLLTGVVLGDVTVRLALEH